MTIDKNFKAKVRARMERTGERYTTARAALLKDGGITVQQKGDVTIVTASRRGDADLRDVVPAITDPDTDE